MNRWYVAGLLIVLAATAQSPFAQSVVLSESFDYTADGLLPMGWSQISLDNGHNDEIFRGGPTIWQAISRVGISTHTGEGTSINAYNSNGAANDDWMILPRFDTLLVPIVFSYWVSSHQSPYLENFEVRISTTDSLPAHFTHLVRSVTRTPHLWTQYTDDISAYAGAPFFLAFHHTSRDDFAIKIDDVQLTAHIPYGALGGTVLNGSTQLPLGNAAVTILGTTRAGATAADGSYLIDSIPAGIYNVRFTKAHFDTLIRSNIGVARNDTAPLYVSLTPANAVALRPDVAEDFMFKGNYPNPFNAQTEFSFDLARAGHVELNLFDLLGRKVAQVTNGAFAPGSHAIPYDARDLASGVYIARLTFNHRLAQSSKLALLR
ncbi:MAG TPA: choice-of-anchor J domain-containing protein [bacterium]